MLLRRLLLCRHRRPTISTTLVRHVYWSALFHLRRLEAQLLALALLLVASLWQLPLPHRRSILLRVR